MGRRLSLLAGLALVMAGAVAQADEPAVSSLGAGEEVGQDGLPLPAELRCLAETIYFEANRSNPEGQRAVGHVVLNRVADERFPSTICAVVRQGAENAPACQFHWYCDGRSDVPDEPDAWWKSVKAAWAVLANPQDDPTGGALFFHNDSVSPGWSRRLERTVRIGAHTYYR